jgi:hypothetical protein
LSVYLTARSARERMPSTVATAAANTITFNSRSPKMFGGH